MAYEVGYDTTSTLGNLSNLKCNRVKPCNKVAAVHSSFSVMPTRILWWGRMELQKKQAPLRLDAVKFKEPQVNRTAICH